MKIAASLILCLSSLVSLSAQTKVGDKWFDNSLNFMVISERVQQRGMMKVCIADSTGNCIQNLRSGFVIRIFDEADQELYAGKTAGRDEMLRFPKALPEARYVVLTAFKPFVLNRATGTRIHQDEPMELKYYLDE